MANKSFLDSISLSSPCSEDWNEMIGDDRVRFCRNCEKSVYNLSAMSRKEARRFAALNSGKVCVRYIRLPDGKIQTSDTKLYKITRRASQLVAGVFGAALTLSTIANAQTPAQPKNESSKMVEPRNKSESQTRQISFTVYDISGAVIPNSEVKLTNQETKKEFITVTDDFGVAEFNWIPYGNYNVKTTARGFQSNSFDVQIKEPDVPNTKVVLKAGGIGEVVTIEYDVPLFVEIIQENNEEVKRQINSGFNINTKDQRGDTALHIAVDHNNLEIVRFLLEQGAQVSVRNKNNQTPLLMLEDNLGDEDNKTLEILRLLITNGADVNAQDEKKRTLLMTACDEENPEAVKILLESGANPNLKNEDGKTALKQTDSDEIIQLLKQYGAKE